MDLTRRLLGFSVGRPHALVVSAAGGTATRLAVESQLRRRDWPVAASPADAQLLVVAGAVGERSGPVIEELWVEMPAPRARVVVARAEHAGQALDAAQAALSDLASQRTRAGRRAARRADQEPSGHDAHTMEMPHGLPMADRTTDRDGLKLDQLQVPFGPFLLDWPHGLVVRLALQGDLVQGADVDVEWDGVDTGAPYWDEPWLCRPTSGRATRGAAARRLAGAHLDSLGRFLAVAGWPAAATRTRRLRDETLADVPGQRLLPAAQSLARRVRRSRTLRWLTDGLGVLDEDAAVAAGVTGPALRAGGDVTARWTRWLAETLTALRQVDDAELLQPDDRDGPRGRLGDGPPPSRPLLDVLPALVDGVDVAAARLIVASLDPDVDEITSVVRAETAGA